MSLRTTLAFCLCVFVWTVPVLAQDFRVTTRLFDEQPAKGQPANPQPILRSWTIFHAGRVYDLVDVAGETTIFEPARERFTILNSGRMLATELTFREIETALYQAERNAEQKLAGNPMLPNREAVAFQLEPKFSEKFVEDQQRLTLSSPTLSYDVKCAAEDPERIAAYLRYANWTARLNYILNSQMLPNPRLALNAALEKRKLLPTEIRLQANVGAGLRRRAEHKFQWSLTPEDRRQINHWDSLLQNPRLKRLSFNEFQKTLAQ